MRVLIADDDTVTVARLKGLVASWGFDPVVARDGLAAVAALSGEDPPRLVLLDWMMPGQSGVEICRWLRVRDGGAGTYVILLTAKDGHADMVLGFDAGADDFLVKPFDTDQLHGRLRAAARIIDLQQRLATNVRELQDALVSVKTLSGMLPICGYCKSIRDDSNYWHQVEEYVTEHSNAEFSHGICPKCLAEVLKQESTAAATIRS